MLPIRQLLNETATDGGTETAETIRQVVRDHEALGARKEPGRNADSSSIVDDTSRKTNMLVSDEKSYKIKFFYRLDKVEQRETMRCWLTQKKSSKYNSLNARKKEDYLNRHVKQLILRSIDQQGVALPSSAAPAILAVADEPRHSPQQASLIKQDVEGRTSASASSSTLATAKRSSSLDNSSPQLQASSFLRLVSPRDRSGICNSLLKLQKLRELDLRPLRDGRLPNLTSRGNLEAAVAYIVGDIVQQPCTRCVDGRGPFPKCIQVKEFLLGSCTNCHYNSGGTQCSLRGRSAAVAVSSSTKAPTSGASLGRKRAAYPLEAGPPARRRQVCAPPRTPSSPRITRASAASYADPVRSPRGPLNTQDHLYEEVVEGVEEAEEEDEDDDEEEEYEDDDEEEEEEYEDNDEEEEYEDDGDEDEDDDEEI
ncbi:hypothetical protein V496_10313 [Pseudogymnoascus sp. VKM F-4515 (FW-2607)]|nr:hypothetical protein V496_10313 [Pseudogymnoascus sp. VKM F-4515 (FW-2607)]